jgi:hypothetical protein
VCVQSLGAPACQALAPGCFGYCFVVLIPIKHEALLEWQNNTVSLSRSFGIDQSHLLRILIVVQPHLPRGCPDSRLTTKAQASAEVMTTAGTATPSGRVAWMGDKLSDLRGCCVREAIRQMVVMIGGNRLSCRAALMVVKPRGIEGGAHGQAGHRNYMSMYQRLYCTKGYIVPLYYIESRD